MTLQDMIEKIPMLTIEERRELIHALVDSLSDKHQPKTHSILELEGLGSEIWEGVDAQAYVDDLRREWDDRDNR